LIAAAFNRGCFPSDVNRTPTTRDHLRPKAVLVQRQFNCQGLTIPASLCKVSQGVPRSA
jgi:hypothetical protein